MQQDHLSIEEFERRHLVFNQVAHCGDLHSDVAALNWIKHGLVPDIEPSQGRGIARRYSLQNLIHLSAMDQLTERVGMKPAEATVFAAKMVKYARMKLNEFVAVDQWDDQLLTWRGTNGEPRAVLVTPQQYARFLLDGTGGPEGDQQGLPTAHVITAVGHWVGRCFQRYVTRQSEAVTASTSTST